MRFVDEKITFSDFFFFFLNKTWSLSRYSYAKALKFLIIICDSGKWY